MIAHAWTVVCEKSIIDRDTNNLSLDVLEGIQYIDIPHEAGTGLMLPMRISIVSLWYRTVPDQPARSQARITYLAPDRSPIGYLLMPLDLSVNERLRSNAVLPELPTKTPGWHFFRVELLENDQWLEVALVPLEIKSLPEGSSLPGNENTSQFVLSPPPSGSGDS